MGIFDGLNLQSDFDRIMEIVEEQIEKTAEQVVKNLAAEVTDRINDITYAHGYDDDGNTDYGDMSARRSENGWDFAWEGEDKDYLEYGYGLRGAQSPHPDPPSWWNYGSKPEWIYRHVGRSPHVSYGQEGTHAPLYNAVRVVELTLPSRMRDALNAELRNL